MAAEKRKELEKQNEQKKSESSKSKATEPKAKTKKNTKRAKPNGPMQEAKNEYILAKRAKGVDRLEKMDALKEARQDYGRAL